jgi:hypothetical protein
MVLAAAALAATFGCERPFLARDGTLVFNERGAHGAAIVTANGLEYHDRDDVPERVVVRDAYAPWRAPIGFILPASGRFTATSRPTLVATTGLAVALRPSDTRVPSWGGEVLVRVDVMAPAAEGTARGPERVSIVIDGAGADTLVLAQAVLGQLGGHDHLSVFDTRGARLVVPSMPASHQSLMLAAIERRLEAPRPASTDLASALLRAQRTVGSAGTRRIVVLSDGEAGELLAPEARVALWQLGHDGVAVTVIGTRAGTDERALSVIATEAGGAYSAAGSLDERSEVLRRAVPPAGLVVFRDVVLSFEGTPAPSHVIEASGGDVRWRLEAGELAIGDVYAGEMRTEVVRVTVPAWVPGEAFKFTVTASFDDLLTTGERRAIAADVPCVYDDDIERIAESRHGDVIAYASALATLHRLDAAFIGGGVERAGGLRAVARRHARSMALLARDVHDPSIAEQAELLSALLAATE